jgi:hypothetical protein
MLSVVEGVGMAKKFLVVKRLCVLTRFWIREFVEDNCLGLQMWGVVQQRFRLKNEVISNNVSENTNVKGLKIFKGDGTVLTYQISIF